MIFLDPDDTWQRYCLYHHRFLDQVVWENCKCCLDNQCATILALKHQKLAMGSKLHHQQLGLHDQRQIKLTRILNHRSN